MADYTLELTELEFNTIEVSLRVRITQTNEKIIEAYREKEKWKVEYWEEVRENTEALSTKLHSIWMDRNVPKVDKTLEV